MPKVDPEHRRFCEALPAESAGAPLPWYVSIDKVAARLGLPWEEAVVLADDGAKAGLVCHDQSQTVKAARGRRASCRAASAWPPGGWLLLRKGRHRDLI